MTGIWPRITLERETREELPARSVELKALAGLECWVDALFLLGATVPAGTFVRSSQQSERRPTEGLVPQPFDWT